MDVCTTVKSGGSDQVNIVVDRGRLKFHFLSINAINLLYVHREPVERHDALESFGPLQTFREASV